jgi:hypothetical protein
MGRTIYAASPARLSTLRDRWPGERVIGHMETLVGKASVPTPAAPGGQGAPLPTLQVFQLIENPLY